MRTDITYVILRPESEAPIGYIRSTLPPSVEEMADHLAAVRGIDRDQLLAIDPHLSLGFAPLH